MMQSVGAAKLTIGGPLAEDKFKANSTLGKKSEHQLEAELDTQVELFQKKFWTSPPLKTRFESSHRRKACQILRALRSPLEQIKRPKFTDDKERILTYELTVSILKYSSFLNDALKASLFAARYPSLLKYGTEEVLVTMYDLLERNFRISPLDAPLSQKFALLQDAVLDSRTKVMAHMARLRIKHEAATLEYLLPEKLRHQQHIDKNPLYIWVNLKKTNLGEIIEVLRTIGLTRTRVEDDILIQEDYFCTDANHDDLVRLHSKSLGIINNTTNLVSNGKIVIQDKSACMYVYALVRALYFKESMSLQGHLQTHANGFLPSPHGSIENWYDGIFESIGKYISKPNCVIVTNTGSGRSIAHLACLLQEAVPRYISQNIKIDSKDNLAQALRKRFTKRPPLNVIGFGIRPDRLEEITNFIKKQANMQNVKLYAEEFIDIEPTDPRIAGCCAILVNPPSSGSALKDPVAYICSEGGDENVLMHLSAFVHLSRDGPLQLPTGEQTRSLKHALTFPQAKLVMYTTCSVLKCENADVVNNCLQEALQMEDKRKLRILQDIVQRKSSRNYRDINFDLIDMQMVMDGYPKEFFKGKMIDKAPCSASSGVYIAMIRRSEKVLCVTRNVPSANPNKTSISPISNNNSSINSVAVKVQEEQIPLELDDSVEYTAKYILYNFSMGNLSDAQLEKYLAKTLAKFNRFQLKANVLSKKSSTDLVSMLKATVALKSQSKRNLTHKAIVQRVSTPTHASLAKQKEKWLNPFDKNQRTAKNAISSIQTSVSSRESRGIKTAPDLCSQCNPGFNLDRNCVCARHAKKFPDFDHKSKDL